MQALQHDVISLFQYLNQNEEKMVSNMDITLREHQFYHAQINELKLQVKELLDRYETEGYRENEMRVLRSFYNADGIYNGENSKQTLIDLVHGIVCPLPTDITSKLSYETETGYVFLPQGLNIFARESNDTIPVDPETGTIVYTDVDQDGLDQIVDRDPSTYWVRNLTFTQKECVTKVYGEIHIQLPTEGLNNLYSNLLTLRPYPEGSMTIEDIMYKGYGDQWGRLPNFPVEMRDGVEVPVPIKNANRLHMSFEKKEITELRIFFSQPYWFENGDKRVFTYGFQDIDLKYAIYTEKDTEFITELKTSSPTQYFSNVHKPKVISADVSEKDLTDLVETHLFYDEALSTEFEFGSSIVAPLQKVYIKTILRKQGDKVPVLKEMNFSYDFKIDDVN